MPVTGLIWRESKEQIYRKVQKPWFWCQKYPV